MIPDISETNRTLLRNSPMNLLRLFVRRWERSNRKTRDRRSRPVIEDMEGRVLLSTVLYPGDSIYSPNGQFQLTQQTDGNLVLYGPGHAAHWASGTYGQSVADAIMQNDGNFVIYGTNGNALWASNTNVPGSTLHVQDDGNCVIYNGSTPLWATNTVTASVDLNPGQSIYSPNGQFQ